MKKWMPLLFVQREYTSEQQGARATMFVRDMRALMDSIHPPIKSEKDVTITVQGLIDRGLWPTACEVLGMDVKHAGTELELEYPIAMSVKEAKTIGVI